MRVRNRSIAIFTGKRGGAGAMSRIIERFDQSEGWQCSVLTSDMHVHNKFGHTAHEVSDFANSVVELPVPEYGSKLEDRAQALGQIYLQVVDYLKKNPVDIVLLLGDRGETLAATFASVEMGVPVAHIQAGDISGGLDNIHRHSITKLAHLHFSQTKLQANRVLSLGEEPQRVHNVGAPYIDNVLSRRIPDIAVVLNELNIPQGKYCIVLQHSDTYAVKESGDQMSMIMRGLDRVNISKIVVYPCSDPGWKEVVDVILEYEGKDGYYTFKSIKFDYFLSLLREQSS